MLTSINNVVFPGCADQSGWPRVADIVDKLDRDKIDALLNDAEFRQRYMAAFYKQDRRRDGNKRST